MLVNVTQGLVLLNVNLQTVHIVVEAIQFGKKTVGGWPLPNKITLFPYKKNTVADIFSFSDTIFSIF